MVLHLEDLMEDTDAYDWEKVKAFIESAGTKQM